MTDGEEYIEDRMAWPHIKGLADAIAPELEARGIEELCESMYGAGAQMAFEACDTSCGGMGWSRLSGMYASSTEFPNPDAQPVKGPLVMAQRFELGIVRGIQLPERADEPMDPDVLSEGGRRQLADMTALLAVICAYFKKRSIPFIVGEYTPYGVTGGCLGGSWTVTAWTGAAPKPRAS